MSVTLSGFAGERPRNSCLINFNKIRSAVTLEYLHKNKLKNSEDLSRILPVCYLEGVSNDFHTHEKAYDFPHSLEKVWDAYVTVPPTVAWGGRRIDYSFAYSPDNDVFHYEDDAYKGLKENQLIFVVIKIFFGLIKIAVTHQVNIISPEKRMIKLCYVEGGKSAGSQILRFESTGLQSSRVIHETYYKSESDFRDRKLYPLLHERVINQLHHNMMKFLGR